MHKSLPLSSFHIFILFILCTLLARNIFRVSSTDPLHGQSHTLHVNDVYHKQQWLNCLRAAIAQQQGAPPACSVPPGRPSDVCDEVKDENCPPVSAPKLRPQTLSKSRLDQKLGGSLKRKETGV